MDFKNLKPNATALNHAGELGREMILDAFLSEDGDPTSHPHGGNVVTSSRGGSFEDHPIGPGSKLDFANTGSSDPTEEPRASRS